MNIMNVDAQTREDMESVTRGLTTKSEKIRTLGRAGYTRRQIADFLGIRYQHVRNVLVDEEQKKSAIANQSPEHAPSVHDAVRVAIGPGGSVAIPSYMLDAAGTGVGKYLLVRFEDDEIHLATPEATTRKVQAMVRKFVPEGVSLVDELLKERRREVEHEQGDA